MTRTYKRLALAGALTFVAVGASAQDTTWRVPTSVPEGSPFYINFLERFADNVDVLTDGTVEIEPFGAGVLVPALQVYQGVRDGVVEAGHSTPCFRVNEDPTNAIFCSFPGGMGPEAHSTWMLEGGGRELLEEMRAEEGFKTLIVGLGSSEIMAHSNVPIRSAEDLKGLKYRTAGAWGEVLRDSFGSVPTTVPPGEIYTLLERKGVDAIEWAPPSANLPEGFHEAAPYIITPGVHQPTFVWEVVLKQETWDELDEATQAKIEAAAELTSLQSLMHFYDQDIKAMETLRNSNAEIIEISPEFQAELGAAGVEWMKKTAEAQKEAGNPRMAEILDEYLAYEDRWSNESGYLIRNGK
ncbi:TRAP transporter substrate-binding protein DctP [Acuticoccus sp. M5D2P5]|uniref:TRAP transporter substrate-binding protein DctP n=1 Tax=Acuticoccus kalidii TaxID=2910977 RepID=UPI001F250835|nr:TRAP transporter substrate-binding protein DctP [Acuticoccus kalidii]MCF3934763.1 TRAP transporter substrate-binding protein DctP [Acuticoccus kalidii]